MTPSVWVDWGPQDLQALDSSTVFVCDPSVFEKVDDSSTLWRDTTTGYFYTGLASSSVICPPGVKTASAEHLARPMHFTIVLCPEVLTQTPAKHRMFTGVESLELPHTRDSADADGNNEDPIDEFAWIDMSIDELRQNVLSVWMGRVIMYIQGIKFEKKIVDNSGNTEGTLTSGAEPKSLLLTSTRLIRLAVSYSPNYRDFDTAKNLPSPQGLNNIDSLSLFITGMYTLNDAVLSCLVYA